MIKGRYIWKKKSSSIKSLPLIVGSIIAIIILVTCTTWYFLMYIPQKEQKEREISEQQQRVQKKQQIENYYSDILSGGDVHSLIDLVTEIDKSRIPLELSGYQENTISCDKQSCSFQYSLKLNGIFNLQKKYFWGQEFTASFSERQMNYEGLPAKMSQNKLTDKYKNGDDITLPLCVDVLNYIYSHNTYSDKKDYIKIVTSPTSSIEAIEKELKTSLKKNYGILNSTWEIELPNNSLYTMQYFSRLAYQNAFLIKKLVINDKLTKISGGFVCVSGK
jgi:preprotein translocase subunit YajC